MPAPFDPLRALTAPPLQCQVSPGRDGGVRILFDRSLPPHLVRKARAIVATYERLIALQLAEGGASVQKLIAQGKLQIRAGRYRLPHRPSAAPPEPPG